MIVQSISYTTKIILMLLLVGQVRAQSTHTPQGLDLNDTKSWRVEFEYPERSRLEWQDDAVIISSYGGATLWLDSLLHGDYEIEYERMVLVDTGVYDRLSDLNQFWLASEPDRDGQLEHKDGKLSSYDRLILFYVGMGGNYNSTTRFRRYDGAGNRVLLAEKNEQPYLLRPNIYYRVKTVVSNSAGFTAFYINDELFFKYEGTVPAAGFFGFRQTASRQQIRNFCVKPISKQ